MELEFENLIDSKTGETVKLEVPDDFDTAPMEEWGRRGRESGERMRKALASPRVEMPPNLSREEKRQFILESFGSKIVENQEDIDNTFSEAVDEHFWDLI